MADVTGRIGNEEVELNNAATEATLRLLLQATLAANKQTIDSVSKIATKAGLDPAAVSAANDNLNTMGTSAQQGTSKFYKLGFASGVVEQGFRNVDNAITPLISKLMEGTDKASDVFSAFSKLPFGIGLVAELFGRLAGFQEKNLQTYQQLSQTGISFNGSLTDMRMAAQNTYMTLDEFSRVMKANGATFANLGGTVNGGAMAFTKLSNSLLKSESGEYLRNLGYTTEQVNQGLASYLAATGGRNKKEMQNTEALIKGATDYMNQLQGLADLTGVSREELDKEIKERSKNAAWEAKLAGMSEEEKKKAIAGLANALATGGKGAADAFQSKVMGVPPITKEAQMFTATMGKTNESIMRSAKNVTDSSKTLDDQNKEYVRGVRANQEDMKKFPLEMQFALGAMGSEVSKSLETGQKLKTRSEKISDEEMINTLSKSQKEKALKDTEAANAVKTQKAVQEMGQTIMSALMPALQLLTSIMNPLVRGIGWVVEKLAEFKYVTLGITATLAAWWALEKVKLAMQRVQAAKSAGGSGILGGLGVSGALGFGGPLGSKTNPMYVIIVGGGAGGLGDMLGGKGGPGGKGGAMGKLSKGALLKGGAGVLGGMALEYAGGKLKESGHEKLGAGAEVAGGALSGASTGAMIGSIIPGLGTAIGASIGGLIGGGLALMNNWDTITGPGKNKNEEEIPKHAEGGIATKPTMGIFGEAGPEALIPLDKLQQMTRPSPELLFALQASNNAANRSVKMPDTAIADKLNDVLKTFGPALGPIGIAGSAIASIMSDKKEKNSEKKNPDTSIADKLTDALKTVVMSSPIGMAGSAIASMLSDKKEKSSDDPLYKMLGTGGMLGIPEMTESGKQFSATMGKGILAMDKSIPEMTESAKQFSATTGKGTLSIGDGILWMNKSKEKSSEPDYSKMLGTGGMLGSGAMLGIPAMTESAKQFSATMGKGILWMGQNKEKSSELTNSKLPLKVDIGTDVSVKSNVSGSVGVSNFPVSQAVTGKFWQTIQPVTIDKSIFGMDQNKEKSSEPLYKLLRTGGMLGGGISSIGQEMTEDSKKYSAKMDNGTSSMDKIKDMLGSLGSAALNPIKAVDKAVSSMLGENKEKTSEKKALETLSKEIESLNKSTIAMIKELKDISDNTKQNVSATKSLSGDLFKF
jgi:hypothetical protein